MQSDRTLAKKNDDRPGGMSYNDGMIVEGIVTSLSASGAINVAPMGPIVDDDFQRLLLRPFKTSQTYRNLKEHPWGVFHVVDDVLLIARAALDRLPETPVTSPAFRIPGQVLADCCRWYEFEVASLDDSADRTEIEARVVHGGRVRDMFGLNRARHAVLEATILATRLHLLPESEIRERLAALRSPVEKTAGPREFEAWGLVIDVIEDWYRCHPATGMAAPTET